MVILMSAMVRDGRDSSPRRRSHARATTAACGAAAKPSSGVGSAASTVGSDAALISPRVGHRQPHGAQPSSGVGSEARVAVIRPAAAFISPRVGTRAEGAERPYLCSGSVLHTAPVQSPQQPQLGQAVEGSFGTGRETPRPHAVTSNTAIGGPARRAVMLAGAPRQPVDASTFLVDGVFAPPSPGAESRPAAASSPHHTAADSGSGSEQEAPSEASASADLLSTGQLLDGPEEPYRLKIVINGIDTFVNLANLHEVEALAFLQSRSA